MFARLLLLVASLASAQNQPLWPTGWKPLSHNQFGGLNLLSDPSMLGDDAQQAQNVLTDGAGLEKRPGNVRLIQISTGSPVKYITDWVASNGSRYLIAQASNTIYETNFSGVPVVLSTIASGANLTTVAAFSNLYFSDGFRPLWFWDGNSTGTVTDTNGRLAPICKYIAFKDSRLWCSNLAAGFAFGTTPGGDQSTVLVSSAGGAGDWSVPSNVGQVDNTPNRFDFNPDDGDQNTCLASTPWGMFSGKRNSSHIIKGNGNLSYDPRLLDPKIGCVDNRSVQMVYGVLEWLGVDGVYGYDGSGPPHLLTRELDPFIPLIREGLFSQQTWKTQRESDWATGTESTVALSLPPQGPWDFASLPGEIFPSSFTMFDSNINPGLETCRLITGTSNLGPFKSCIGFSSDTVVNIDTTSFPLSIGSAELSIIPGGVVISSANTKTMANTQSTFATGPTVAAFAALPPGWVRLIGEGTFEVPCQSFVSNRGSGLCGDGLGSGTIRHTMYSTSTLLTTMVGSWSYDMNVNGTITSGQCVQTIGECAEFNFINDAIPLAIGHPNNAYGLRVDQTSVSHFALTLNKYTNGGRFILGTYNFIGLTSVVNLTVTRGTAGNFSVYYGSNGVTGVGGLVFSATDSAIKTNAAESISLYQQVIPGTGGWNTLVPGFSKTVGYARSGYILSRIFDTGMGAPLAGVLSSSYTLQGPGATTAIDFYLRDSTSPNNDMWSAWQASSNSVLAVLPLRYWQYSSTFTTSVSSYTPILSTIELDAITTGYYYSQVDFIGTLLTSWGQFGVTEANPGLYGYAVRDATYAFPAGDITIPWVAQTANQLVNLSVSTPTYAQFRLDSTPLATNPLGASSAEPIFSIFLSWNQGVNIPVASDTLERRYILCVAISTSATAPDTCLLRQKTGKWVFWNTYTTVGAMGLYNNQQIAAAGDSSSVVWTIMQPNVYNDDGNPINSIWVGADEMDSLPFNKKDYYGTLVQASPIQGGAVTFSYQVNRSSGFVNQPFSLDNGMTTIPPPGVIGTQYGSLNQWLPPVVGYDQGMYIRSEFSDNTTGNYFLIISYLNFVHDEGWQEP